MEPLLSAVERLNVIIAGTPLAAERLEQNVEGVGDEPADGARSIYIEQLESKEDIEFAMYRYVSKYGGVNRPDLRSVLEVRMEHDEQEVLAGDA